jgi:cell division protease FtsH
MSIVPRGNALGFVAPSVEEDRYLKSRGELLDDVVTALGGRAAEEEVYGEGYSGVSSDLSHVYAICAQMVTEFGMGVAIDHDGPPPIAMPTGNYAISDATRREADLAAMTLAREAYRRARALLSANRGCLDDLAANALERETLTREDLDEIFAAHELRGLVAPHGSGAALVAMSKEMRQIRE